ncbi:hypothetical protein JCM19275_178 [Nonlabens ulvanivorans]|uniref:Uncharacterized protein n=1 Tax=Nonlabens ulvanivorans TaxID=906888 RepID=A0A090WKL3_NONUL|nr:hypothetical protein JCM19275_178 [Nonlabens ulvanivorans]
MPYALMAVIPLSRNGIEKHLNKNSNRCGISFRRCQYSN